MPRPVADAATTGRRSFPVRWWRRRSLRARITLLATGVFTVALLLAGVILLVTVGRSLLNTLDSSAERTGNEVAALVNTGRLPQQLLTGSGGVSMVQVVDADNRVIAASPGVDTAVSMVNSDQLAKVRRGAHLTVSGARSSQEDPIRVVAVDANTRNGPRTVLVGTDLGRVFDSSRLLQRALLFGGPLIVIAMAALTWWVVGLTLQPVAALRRGAAQLSAAGLERSRLPVPDAQDEIHSLALTLNDMLDRLDSATARQRRFVGDAAHELRSPIASLRLQLEVAQRLDQSEAMRELTDDALLDVDRLAHLIDDLLALARSDERGGGHVRLPVRLAELAGTVVASYRDARVSVSMPAGDGGDRARRRRRPAPGAGQPDRQRGPVRGRHGDGGGRRAAAGRTGLRRRGAHRRRRRARGAGQQAGAGVRPVLPARHRPVAGRGRHRARAVHRAGDRHRARRHRAVARQRTGPHCRDIAAGGVAWCLRTKTSAGACFSLNPLPHRARSTMDFTESPEHRALRASVAELGREFGMQYWLARARNHESTDELWEKAAQLGFIGINTPEQYGGGGAGITELAMVCEELATAGSPLLLLVVSPAICATILAQTGTEEQRRRFLPGMANGSLKMAFAITEPDAGTNSHRIATTGIEQPDGSYRLTGRKYYISAVDQADYVLVVGQSPASRAGGADPAGAVSGADRCAGIRVPADRDGDRLAGTAVLLLLRRRRGAE